MQVPLIDRLNDLQVGLNSLHNPSLPSQITSSLTVSVAYNFCKWGAVILALVATFGSIINRVTIFIIRFRNKATSSLPSIPFLDGDDDDDDDDDDCTSSDDDDDYTSSEFRDEEHDDPSSSSKFHRVHEYFRFNGSDDDEFLCGTHKRRRSFGDIFSLSEIANGKSVVKLWDSIGFGLALDFDDYEETVDPVPAVSNPSPAVVVSAGEGSCGNLAVKIWDTRLRRRKPSVVAEWGASVGKAVRVESGGVQKVYVRDDGRYGVTVGDMRNVRTPLGNVTESDADIWWDADGIIVSDESYGNGEDQSLLHPT